MITRPSICRVAKLTRMASTAAPSPDSLSPRPSQRAEAKDAASVIRTISRARFFSGASAMTSSGSNYCGLRPSFTPARAGLQGKTRCGSHCCSGSRLSRVADTPGIFSRMGDCYSLPGRGALAARTLTCKPARRAERCRCGREATSVLKNSRCGFCSRRFCCPCREQAFCRGYAVSGDPAREKALQQGRPSLWQSVQ